MSNNNITENKNILFKICSISLTVIFFILSFLTGFNNIVIFVLGLLVLGISVLLSYKSLKGLNYYALGIMLVPLLSYGLIMSLSYFSSALYSVSTRVFLTINILLFVISGYFSKKIDGFDFEWVFRGIFLSLAVICLINLIFTLVYFGPFYGFRLANYSSYYDGSEARVNVASTAYALCGFNVKQVPIEYYLLYPFLLLTIIFMYLLSNKKDKYVTIFTCILSFIALISIIFVISKISLFFIVLYLLFVGVVSLFILYKKLYQKAFKYVAYAVLGVGVIFFILFFLNSQYSLVGFRNAFSSNRLLNYIFNTNRYSEGARVILNGVFSKGKLIGFPIYFDYDYNLLCAPSINILINQFMYGGVFGFLFFIIFIMMFVYLFIRLRKEDIENKVYKYCPILFVISYFVITMMMDQNSFDLFDYSLVFANYLSPFFYISLFIFGYYFSLINKEDKKQDEN